MVRYFIRFPSKSTSRSNGCSASSVIRAASRRVRGSVPSAATAAPALRSMAAADDAVSGRGVVGHFDLRRIVVQAAAELTDGDPALGIEPRAVRPLERLARHSQDARRCDALQHREVGVVGFHVVQRRDIRILRQQGGLQPAHRNFAGRAPFPGGDGRQRPCGLSREQDYRLQARRTVDKVRNRYSLVRNHQVVRPGRDHHPHRHRKRRHGREGYLPDLRTAIMVVVDGIVADRNAGTVKCRRRP